MFHFSFQLPKLFGQSRSNKVFEAIECLFCHNHSELPTTLNDILWKGLESNKTSEPLMLDLPLFIMNVEDELLRSEQTQPANGTFEGRLLSICNIRYRS